MLESSYSGNRCSRSLEQKAFEPLEDASPVKLLNFESSRHKKKLLYQIDLQPGAYVSVGHGVTALIDEDTLRVEGYFEENKLPRIHVGDAATVRLIGERTLLTGHVESIAGGIDDRERTSGSNLLANVNPTFSWVRLAQRIPVRIKLEPLPNSVLLVAGRTATVEIKPGPRGPAL